MFVARCKSCHGVFSLQSGQPNQMAVCYHCNTRQEVENVQEQTSDPNVAYRSQIDRTPTVALTIAEVVGFALLVLGFIGIILVVIAAMMEGQPGFLLEIISCISLMGFGCVILCLVDIARSLRPLRRT